MEYTKIQKLYKTKKPIAVTIKLNINEGANPNNNHDRITLKNIIGAAKERLLNEYSQNETGAVLENLHKLEQEISYTRNHKGLVLFVAEDMADFTPLPFPVGNKVKIGSHFSTRTLIRAFNQTEHYYILCLSQNEVRLVECYNKTLLKEHQGDFPLQNEEFYQPDALKRSFGSAEDKLTQQFFREAEEKLQEVYKHQALPVILAGAEEAFANYTSIAGSNIHILGKIRGNFDSHDGKQLTELIDKAYHIVKEHKKEKTQSSFEDMEKAQSRDLLEFDVNNIHQMAYSGQIAELIVDEEYYLRAVMDSNGTLFFNKGKEGTQIDDAVNHIIHLVKATGGDIVFVPPYSIDSSHRMAAILRWR